MTENRADTRDMLAVHQAFRNEFATLPGLIADVPAGDAARAAVVGGHAMGMLAMLQSHHHSEDVTLWPVIRERVPDEIELVDALEGQHGEVHALLESAQAATGAWMATASPEDGARAGLAISAMASVLNDHLAREEAELLPIAERVLTQDEYFAVGEHSRNGLTQEQLTIGLGVIQDAATDEQWSIIFGDLPPEGQAGWEQFGRPAYLAYRSQVLGV